MKVTINRFFEKFEVAGLVVAQDKEKTERSSTIAFYYTVVYTTVQGNTELYCRYAKDLHVLSV